MATDDRGSVSARVVARADIRDHLEIEQLAIRYGWAIQRKDVEALVVLFLPDGSLQYDTPLSAGTGLHQGADQLRQFFRKSTSQMDPWPFISSHIIDQADETHATGSLFVEIRERSVGLQVVAAGTITDDYVKLDGRWYFKRRRAKIERVGTSDSGNP